MMITTIDTKKIGNLVIMAGKIRLILDEPITCGERGEHMDFILKNHVLEMQIVCRGDVGRLALKMKLKKGDKVFVIGYLENDGDTVIIADKIEKE